MIKDIHWTRVTYNEACQKAQCSMVRLCLLLGVCTYAFAFMLLRLSSKQSLHLHLAIILYRRKNPSELTLYFNLIKVYDTVL